MYKLITPLIACIAISACGSINTIGRSNQEVTSSLQQKEGKCSSVSRVYSGVSYDLCVLNRAGKGFQFVESLQDRYFYDIAASAIADTLVLPYTAYTQYKNGSIPVGSNNQGSLQQQTLEY
ncbi:MAG: YceK/YidQ family lipoprotein [Spongiibacteraceae bacterium]|nr:YceK/YidQ family lipoprotein [Spongiibacteraceae bacterium]MBN4055303.1 YceK/YidQ family lipoprotein [bacterium AH-315-K03]